MPHSSQHAGLGRWWACSEGSCASTPSATLPHATRAPLLPNRRAWVRSYLDLWLVIGAHFDAGSTLYGAGFLLVASAALSVVGFPRWLAGWFALSGSWALVSNALYFVGSPVQIRDLFPLYMILGIAGLHLVVAVAFWRRAPAFVPSLQASRAG